MFKKIIIGMALVYFIFSNISNLTGPYEKREAQKEFKSVKNYYDQNGSSGHQLTQEYSVQCFNNLVSDPLEESSAVLIGEMMVHFIGAPLKKNKKPSADNGEILGYSANDLKDRLNSLPENEQIKLAKGSKLLNKKPHRFFKCINEKINRQT
ncbi:MAG: hypothetical protein ABJN04_03560 [Hyphomicrobiales bacterium]